MLSEELLGGNSLNGASIGLGYVIGSISIVKEEENICDFFLPSFTKQKVIQILLTSFVLNRKDLIAQAARDALSQIIKDDKSFSQVCNRCLDGSILYNV